MSDQSWRPTMQIKLVGNKLRVSIGEVIDGEGTTFHVFVLETIIYKFISNCGSVNFSRCFISPIWKVVLLGGVGISCTTAAVPPPATPGCH